MTSVERSEVQFGRTTIPFLVRRSNRRKTVALTVEPPGKLIVTAPKHASIDRLNNLVRNRATWVVKRIKRTSDLPPPPEREFVSGETVRYLGRQYRLKVVARRRDEPEPALKGGWLHVPVPSSAGEAARARAVHRGLCAWMQARAELMLPTYLERLCARHGIETPSIVVREQQKRWGSCDVKGTLRINWRIVQAPVPLIEYVLIHELVHLRHQNHTREFWAEVERLMPDFERRRAELRRIGASLEW